MKALISFCEAQEMLAYAWELEQRLPAPGLLLVVSGWMDMGDLGVWIEMSDDGGVGNGERG